MSAALASLGTLSVLVGAVLGLLRSHWLLAHVQPDPGTHLLPFGPSRRPPASVRPHHNTQHHRSKGSVMNTITIAVREARYERSLGRSWAAAIRSQATMYVQLKAGNALMGAGGVLHRAGNRVTGGGWYDDCAQAYAGGLEEGRRIAAERTLGLVLAAANLGERAAER